VQWRELRRILAIALTEEKKLAVTTSIIDKGEPMDMAANLASKLAKEEFIVGRAENVALADAPIDPDWIVSGNPQARAGLLTPSSDGNASTIVWDCTAGSFRWTFYEEETVVILEGRVRVTSANGEVRLLGPGDIAFFAEGSKALWEIDSYVKKIAFCRRSPVGAIKALRIMLGRMRRSLATDRKAKADIKLRLPYLRTVGVLMLLLPL
jgi:uncharacterized protein